MPRSRCNSRNSSKIWICTVTSSAVVGSSASSTLGLQHKRHRDHRALAHAAGHFVRIGIEAPPRRRDLHLLEQFERAAAGVAAAHTVVPDDGFGDLRRRS